MSNCQHFVEKPVSFVSASLNSSCFWVHLEVLEDFVFRWSFILSVEVATTVSEWWPTNRGVLPPLQAGCILHRQWPRRSSSWINSLSPLSTKSWVKKITKYSNIFESRMQTAKKGSEVFFFTCFYWFGSRYQVEAALSSFVLLISTVWLFFLWGSPITPGFRDGHQHQVVSVLPVRLYIGHWKWTSIRMQLKKTNINFLKKNGTHQFFPPQPKKPSKNGPPIPPNPPTFSFG